MFPWLYRFWKQTYKTPVTHDWPQSFFSLLGAFCARNRALKNSYLTKFTYLQIPAYSLKMSSPQNHMGLVWHSLLFSAWNNSYHNTHICPNWPFLEHKSHVNNFFFLFKLLYKDSSGSLPFLSMRNGRHVSHFINKNQRAMQSECKHINELNSGLKKFHPSWQVICG